MPCGDTWHTDSTQEVADRHVSGINLAKHGRHIGIHHAVGLPAAHADHFVAHGKLGMTALHHLAHSACNHDCVQGLWRGIAFAVVHAATHIGVQAHVLVFDQHLLVLQSGCLQGEQFEVVSRGFARGAADQMDLGVVWHGSLLFYPLVMQLTPPSTASHWPVMCLPASDAYSTVMPFKSSLSPKRRKGALAFNRSSP